MGDPDILVVVSKLKAYMSKGGMNTSSNVAKALSDKVRQMCDEAIDNAKADRRKTVMDRDFR